MQRDSTPTPHPAALPAGTVVGPWRVVDWAGRGVHGAVYRAVPVDSEQASSVALKVALLPNDPRFVREAKLLSRTQHPSVPQLVDSGRWQHPSGSLYPFVAMEWIDGVPLYDWARLNPPSQGQVLRLLAQLAGALAALHAQGGIHRDVKGGNVLVRRSDGRAMLTDFGTGRYPGAFNLTPPNMLPGTPAYRAPEAGLFELQSLRDASARYTAGPADDLFSLGVTACRLVTGEYTDFSEPFQDDQGKWHVEAVIFPASLQQAVPPLREAILRLLALRPEQRGTAAELASALETAGEAFSSEPLPLPPAEALPTARALGASARRSSSRGQAEPGLLIAAAMMALSVSVWWVTPDKRWGAQQAVGAKGTRPDHKDGNTSGLGETVAAMSQEQIPAALTSVVVAEDPLPEPLPGQAVPDAKGRCPYKRQVALNGACWVPQVQESEACEALTGQRYQGACYIPVFPRDRPQRPPTSGPTRKAPHR